MQLALTLDDLLSAWERVLENEGCAGADGVTVREFAHDPAGRLDRLLSLVRSDSYLPFPLLKIVIEKQAGSGHPRTLMVPAVRDRVMQTAVARELSRSFEEEFLECSYAYRPGRGVDRAIARLREMHLEGYEHVARADIQSFFDEVDHGLLLAELQRRVLPSGFFTLLRLWTRGEIWDGARLHPLRKGIPQGSPLSPLLANLFLEKLDLELEEAGCRAIRYADDLVIAAKSQPDAQQALERVRRALSELNLDLNAEKTETTTFAAGFQFLGAYFDRSEIWTPWKDHRAVGRLVFMAHPLPPRLRRRYEQGDPCPPPLAAALRRSWEESEPTATAGSLRSTTMAFLYLTQQGSVLRKSGDRLLVEKDDRILLDTPYHKLDHVLVFGNVQVTTQALGELLEKGVAVSLFSRQGNFRGAVSPPRGKNIELRIKQFQAYLQPARALAIARALVAAKIENGGAVLARYAARLPVPGTAPCFSDDVAAATCAVDIAVLDGVEGNAARRYFDSLMTYNKSALVWDGRKKHPAPDPLNALLSLAYTMLMHELGALLEGLGLDPYLGFLHQMDYGRPSLALDVMEPFRHPVADRFVLQLVNKNVVGVADFESHGTGAAVFLKPPALIRFFEFYEKWMLNRPPGQPSFRERLRHAAEALDAAIRDESDYVAYRFDHEVEEECFTSSVTI